ncbi:MAG: hypothetical protein LLG06_17045 [Desulfobacteraceae bacterium]|nr:hypothetical protein [Desulfobacteraceae bacterium]
MQIIANIILYGFLAWQIYECTIAKFDPWMLFVNGFVVLVAIGLTLTPSLHAPDISPGVYPYDD